MQVESVLQFYVGTVGVAAARLYTPACVTESRHCQIGTPPPRQTHITTTTHRHTHIDEPYACAAHTYLISRHPHASGSWTAAAAARGALWMGRGRGRATVGVHHCLSSFLYRTLSVKGGASGTEQAAVFTKSVSIIPLGPHKGVKPLADIFSAV